MVGGDKVNGECDNTKPVEQGGKKRNIWVARDQKWGEYGHDHQIDGVYVGGRQLADIKCWHEIVRLRASWLRCRQLWIMKSLEMMEWLLGSETNKFRTLESKFAIGKVKIWHSARDKGMMNESTDRCFGTKEEWLSECVVGAEKQKSAAVMSWFVWAKIGNRDRKT